jgi:hypothetical protein
MMPTPEQIEGYELAMEYCTQVVHGDLDAAGDTITKAFANKDTAVSYVVAISNFAVAMNANIAKAIGTTPQEAWSLFAQAMQANRPPEWDR